MADNNDEDAPAIHVNYHLNYIHSQLVNIGAKGEKRERDDANLYNEAFLLQAIVGLRDTPITLGGMRALVNFENPADTVGGSNGDGGCGGYDVLMDVLRRYPDHTQIKINTLWAIYNLTTDTLQFRNAGIVPLFIKILANAQEEKDVDVISGAAFGLGNMARYSIGLRDLILESGGVEACVSVLKHPTFQAGNRKNVTWALLNMCRGDPSPTPQEISKLIDCYSELLVRLIAEREAAYGNPEIEENIKIETIDILWGISYITDRDAVQRMLASKFFLK